MSRLADLRRSRLWLRRDTFLKGTRRSAAARDITCLHPSGREMTAEDWNDSGLHCLAVHMSAAAYSSARSTPEGDLLAIFNAKDAPLDLVLPQPSLGDTWRVLIYTAQPARVTTPGPVRPGEIARVESRSTMLLESDVRGVDVGS